MNIRRKIIEIDEDLCTGCGECVPSCAEGAIELVDGKARLVADKYCDGLGACLGECPVGALRIVEREAEDFDEQAVHAFLAERKHREEEVKTLSSPPKGGCPSARLQSFIRPENRTAGPAGESALSTWPVQIRLVPPGAPFLKNANLLVTADCVPVAHAGFHRDFLEGRVVMLGCPKFDDLNGYLAKFTEIFKRGDLESVTVLAMEVPCCGVLPLMLKKARTDAGADIPMEQVIISTRGEVLAREVI